MPLALFVSGLIKRSEGLRAQAEAHPPFEGWEHISPFIALPLCRISLTLACAMDLALFPLDTQTCHLRIASCEYIAATILTYCHIWYQILTRLSLNKTRIQYCYLPSS